MGNAVGIADIPLDVKENIQQLIKTIDSTTGDDRLRALASLQTWEMNEVNKPCVPLLMHPSLNLIPVMKRAIESAAKRDDDEEKEVANTAVMVLYTLAPFCLALNTANYLFFRVKCITIYC